MIFGVVSAMLVAGCKQSRDVKDPITGAKAGEERCFTIGHGVDLEFRWAPAGKFMMGSPPDELGRCEGEDQKIVRITEGFWIAENECTLASWLKVMGIEAPNTRKPVVYVSWYDCRNFLRRLKSPAPGWKYELPTEAQWEYACRAGNNSAYARPPAELGWITTNSGGRSHPVGMKTPNAWSIRDMHGNVAEWCRDAVGPQRNEFAIRGGSWSSDLNSRAAARSSDTPFLRINRVGFRLVIVRDIPPIAGPLSPVCAITPPQQP